MNLLSRLTNYLPFGKKEELPQYFFALNISADQLTAALWSLKGTKLQVLETATGTYKGESDLVSSTDPLLSKVLGTKEIEVEKILFGVPDSWLLEDDLKEEYLKLLRGVVKELELQPMAYVATSHALAHFLEKKENVPTTAILVGFEQKHLSVTVVRAGKLDGTKLITRSQEPGVDIEKALLTFTQVETLPSKILIYVTSEEFEKLEKIKEELLAYSWMSKLSFLHFPKIEILEKNLEIKSVCFAGGFEINNDVVFIEKFESVSFTKPIEEIVDEVKEMEVKEEEQNPAQDLGFVVGDVSKEWQSAKGKGQSELEENKEDAGKEKDVTISEELKSEDSNLSEVEDDISELEEKGLVTKKEQGPLPSKKSAPLIFGRFIPKGGKITVILVVILLIIAALVAAYLFIPKAEVKVFVEPRVLEKDSEITADPKQKEIDKDKKIIPGQIVETEISGTEKGSATGLKEIGDPAKGVVVIRNKIDQEKKLSKGAILISPLGLKFVLDNSISIASRSAEDGTFGKVNADVVAQNIGAEGNLPSGTELTIQGFSTDQLSAKSEGNFSGGTSKTVTVVSDSDQKKLLAQVASNLRKQAQQKLQEKIPEKKVLEEALSEQIVKKSYSKNINDQTNEFSLNLTIKFKGTAYDDKDLRQIISDLVTTDVPEGFQLSLQDTETQADVSKLEDDGKLIFLARFRAKLMPKIDMENIKREIRGKSFKEAGEILKGIDNVLDSEIALNPAIPFLQYLPFLERQINVEVRLK